MKCITHISHSYDDDDDDDDHTTSICISIYIYVVCIRLFGYFPLAIITHHTHINTILTLIKRSKKKEKKNKLSEHPRNVSFFILIWIPLGKPRVFLFLLINDFPNFPWRRREEGKIAFFFSRFLFYPNLRLITYSWWY